MGVFRRDNWTCQYCGKKGNRKTLTIDHVIPKSKGGKTDWNNLVVSCSSCNTKKGDELLKDMGVKLKVSQSRSLKYAKLSRIFY